MAGEKIVTYTAEQTAQVLDLYAGGAAVKEIALTVGKSERSVIAKLAREGVYKPKELLQPRRMKKAEMVEAVAKILGIEALAVESLEKATHEALEMVYKALHSQCEVTELRVA